MTAREDEFVDALYLGVRDQYQFDQALRLLCDLFDVTSASLLDFDAARPEVSTYSAVGIFSGEVAERYVRDFAELDPAPPAFMTRPVGTAISTYRLLPEERKRPGIFYSEFFRPLGLEECLGGTLAAANGRFGMIGLHRTPDRAPFDDLDIAKLEALMPHLSRALQLRRSFIELERKTGALAETCDRLSGGLLALDVEGNSLFVNAAARCLSLANDGLGVDRNGRPLAADRTSTQRLAELEAEVRAGGPGGVVRVARANGKTPYAIMVAPLAMDRETNARGRRGTLFIIHDPLRRAPSPPEWLADAFDLPRGAANLVAALAAGEELRSYAERAGISLNTVNFHLKTAFSRTGVRRQAELMRLIISALNNLADYRQRGE